MARKRKTEAKASSPKQEPEKPTTLRKSTRQRGRKAQEEQKVNGDDVTANPSISEDSTNDLESMKPVSKTVPKKSTRYKNFVNKESTELECENGMSGESISQDSVDVNVLKQSNANEQSVSLDWTTESIVEETIICEEMEIEEPNGSNVEGENVVLEQIEVIEDFNVASTVVYTNVQENSVASESVIVLTNEEEKDLISTNESTYQAIQQGLCGLKMSDSDNAKLVLKETEKKVQKIKTNSDSEKIDTSKLDSSKIESRPSRSTTRNSRTTRNKSNNDKSSGSESDKKKYVDRSTRKSSVDKSKSSKSQEVTEKMTNVEPNVTENLVISSHNFPQNCSSPVANKIECKDSAMISIAESYVNKIVNIEQANPVNPLDNKSVDTTNQSLNQSKQLLIGNEEHSQDSLIDVKMDCEDVRQCSSSENSNDTLLFSTSGKVSDVDSKNVMNDVDKKLGFRSRSGSTDTTGSESGSNSSGVRRSSRIKTIGLLNKRSRGRGLVTKPTSQQLQAVDPTKIPVQPETEKITSATPPVIERNINQSRDILETVPEVPSENSNKTIIQNNFIPSMSTVSGNSGYDSDSNKPVKVKSRWRRSSELEMSAAWLGSRPNVGLPNSTTIGVSQENSQNFLNDMSITKSSQVNLPQDVKMAVGTQELLTSGISSDSITAATVNSELLMDNLSTSILSPDVAIPKTVGAKIALPMVNEIDREMEERLSQFEHLKENLYLTERITNKDTKRMLCDCFLTDEEIQRGELGCGEDCLNRLLMIECGPRCNVGDRCTNKRFQNSDYATCEVFRTEKKGFGLRATTELYSGDFIMEYVGEVVDPRNFRKRAKEYSKDKNRHYYFMALKSDQIIDATMKGNISRFINHSCDPNAETQKWTVNGELRIGFFSKKYVPAGEEITFDYHFQRYGKEAQKCFCEASNCRGWIGDNPEDNKNVESFEDADDMDDTEDEIEDEDDKENKEEKPEKKVRRRRRKTEKKVTDHMEDEDLEEQIDKLCASGLKNRSHTLTLSRLMVRSREIQHRTRLLKVIQSGEQPCRRLFLDYHGLRLMWSYMMDVAGSATEEAHQFRLEILKTLSKLPIPNRTMLIDSKVLDVIEKWSKRLPERSPSGDSPEDEQSKLKSASEEAEIKGGEKDNTEVKEEIKTEVQTESAEQAIIADVSSGLLVEWSNLKEVFRIPKKERIEQMKEHEREADRGYKEDVEKEMKDNSSYDRHRYSGRCETDKRPDRRRGRDSPDLENVFRSKDKRGLDDRPNLVQVPRMTKAERRQLFALKVAKEEEERQRRQSELSFQQHEAQCLALGLDPYATAVYDQQSGYSLLYNPQLGHWFPIQDPPVDQLAQQCTPVYTPVGLPAGTPQQVIYPGYGTPVQVTPNGPAYGNPQPVAEAETSPQPQPPPALDLPPKWKWARDKRGRVYYYHVKERVSQWLPPPPDHIGLQPDSEPSSSSSEESSSSDDEDADEDEEEEDEEDEEQAEPDEEEEEREDEEEVMEGSIEQQVESMEVEQQILPRPEPRKRRDGLVQERIISPRREEDRVDHKKYKETKEKLRRQKERAKLKEQEKLRKHRRSSKSKSHAKHLTKLPITSDMSPTQERKIKDTFRTNMAQVMVLFLNPYRKPDCKQGRITNTEDFKHLARKLTHFVLAKELKHCKSVDELECNDNVKHKAKDFVRKYMNKFGETYQRDDAKCEDED